MAAGAEKEDISMADASLAPSISAAAQSKSKKQSKSRELFSCTISKPPFAYARVEVSTAPASEPATLDALQVRSYTDAALRQFLGASGAGMPLDLLKIEGREFWVRLPREDLGLFAAALAAWVSAPSDGTITVLRLRASGNWLGSLVGRREQQAIWAAS